MILGQMAIFKQGTKNLWSAILHQGEELI